MSYNPKYNETAYKYAKDKLKRIPLDVQQEYYNTVLKPAADLVGEKINTFIKKAIEQRINSLSNSYSEIQIKE